MNALSEKSPQIIAFFGSLITLATRGAPALTPQTMTKRRHASPRPAAQISCPINPELQLGAPKSWPIHGFCACAMLNGAVGRCRGACSSPVVERILHPRPSPRLSPAAQTRGKCGFDSRPGCKLHRPASLERLAPPSKSACSASASLGGSPGAVTREVAAAAKRETPDRGALAPTTCPAGPGHQRLRRSQLRQPEPSQAVAWGSSQRQVVGRAPALWDRSSGSLFAKRHFGLPSRSDESIRPVGRAFCLTR